MSRPIRLTNAIASVVTSRSRSPLRRGFLIALGLAVFALSPTPNAFAVTPPPDGGYPNENTAEGQDALFNLTTGTGNTAIGFDALFSNTAGPHNTATGVARSKTTPRVAATPLSVLMRFLVIQADRSTRPTV